MRVQWKDPTDVLRLRQLVREEPNAKQRDRYRVVLLAGEGLGEARPELERQQIASTVGRSRQFVDQWVGRYRKQGIDGLAPKRQPGAKPKLSEQEQQQLCAMLDAGPDRPDGPDAGEAIAAFNGPMIRGKIHQHFGKLYSLAGVYALLHRLGYNDLMPRTTHPDTDPAELERFKKKSCPSVFPHSKPTARTNAC